MGQGGLLAHHDRAGMVRDHRTQEGRVANHRLRTDQLDADRQRHTDPETAAEVGDHRTMVVPGMPVPASRRVRGLYDACRGASVIGVGVTNQLRIVRNHWSTFGAGRTPETPYPAGAVIASETCPWSDPLHRTASSSAACWEIALRPAGPTDASARNASSSLDGPLPTCPAFQTFPASRTCCDQAWRTTPMQAGLPCSVKPVEARRRPHQRPARRRERRREPDCGDSSASSPMDPYCLRTMPPHRPLHFGANARRTTAVVTKRGGHTLSNCVGEVAEHRPPDAGLHGHGARSLTLPHAPVRSGARKPRSRSALVGTKTLESPIAAAARIGERSRPKAG